jgi:hypothetical protein
MIFGMSGDNESMMMEHGGNDGVEVMYGSDNGDVKPAMEHGGKIWRCSDGVGTRRRRC